MDVRPYRRRPPAGDDWSNDDERSDEDDEREGPDMWRPGRRNAPGDDGHPVAEAARLLDGRAGEAGTDSWAPGWVAVNVLAHADVVRLQELAAECGRRGWTPSTEWLGRLAAEMLRIAPTEPELVTLQREVLVPLELQLLDDRIALPPTRKHLFDLILDGLDGRPGGGRAASGPPGDAGHRHRQDRRLPGHRRGKRPD
ncbi:MAG TPA: hypothetical protein VHB02_12600 [Acidimicrobiales bacterium]|nr:hypothetical protein [Acidimicrobiales bacterium]